MPPEAPPTPSPVEAPSMGRSKSEIGKAILWLTFLSGFFFGVITVVIIPKVPMLLGAHPWLLVSLAVCGVVSTYCVNLANTYSKPRKVIGVAICLGVATVFTILGLAIGLRLYDFQPPIPPTKDPIRSKPQPIQMVPPPGGTNSQSAMLWITCSDPTEICITKPDDIQQTCVIPSFNTRDERDDKGHVLPPGDYRVILTRENPQKTTTKTIHLEGGQQVHKRFVWPITDGNGDWDRKDP